VATWNTRRGSPRAWPRGARTGSSQLLRAAGGGCFPLFADIFWNPKDEAASYALIVDPRRWTPIATTTVSVVPRPKVSRVTPGSGAGADEAKLRPGQHTLKYCSKDTSSRRALPSAGATHPPSIGSFYFSPTGRDSSPVTRPRPCTAAARSSPISDLREAGTKLAAALGTAAATASLSDNSGDNSVTARKGRSLNI
jgi:hypothetical protein